MEKDGVTDGLLSADIDRDEGATRFPRAWGLTGLLLMLGGVAMFWTSAEVPSTNGVTDLALKAGYKSGTMMGQKFNCTDYDDDSFYTADLCGQFDGVLCDGTNDDDVDATTSSCYGSFWCNEFCSAACDDSAGAICMFELFSDMANTCAKVSAVAAVRAGAAARAHRAYAGGHVAKSAAVKRAYAAKVLGKGAALAWKGGGVDFGQGDDGCAMHSYCDYCTGDCDSNTLQNYIVKMFGEIGPGQIKAAVDNIDTMCEDLGYF